MGLLSNIGNLIGKTASAVLTPISAAVAAPLTFITNPTKAITQFKTASPIETTGKVLSNVGIVLATTLLPSTKAKVIGGVVAAVGIPAITSSPKLQTDIINAPASAQNFGGNIGELIQNPSLEAAKNVITENPIVAGVVGAGILGAVGLGTATLVSNISNTLATKENTRAVEAGLVSSQPAVYTTLPTNNLIPTTPATETISGVPATLQETGKTASIKRKKRASQPRVAIISQRVNVLVSQKNQSNQIRERYLNVLPLRN